MELIKILDKEIRVIEYKGQKVVTFEMIDELLSVLNRQEFIFCKLNVCKMNINRCIARKRACRRGENIYPSCSDCLNKEEIKERLTK